MSQQLPVRGGVLAAAVGVVLATAGCGDERPDVDDSGAMGPDESVSDTIEVVQVQLEYPLDGEYERGEDARLFLGITNDGTEDDALVDVRGADFADAEFFVDGRAAEFLPVPAQDNVYIGAEDEPWILLEDLRTTLRSAQSTSVTLVFDDAGEVMIDAMVAAGGQDPSSPFDFPDPAEDPT